MKRLIPCSVLLLLILGCRNVQRSEVIGLWVMSESSREVLPTELRIAKPKLYINSDGTFRAQEMPGLLEFPSFRESRLDSGDGRWKMVSREGKPQIQLDFVAINDWKDRPLPYGTQLDVSSGSSPILYYFFGDADQGRRIEFQKK